VGGEESRANNTVWAYCPKGKVKGAGRGTNALTGAHRHRGVASPGDEGRTQRRDNIEERGGGSYQDDEEGMPGSPGVEQGGKGKEKGVNTKTAGEEQINRYQSTRKGRLEKPGAKKKKSQK